MTPVFVSFFTLGTPYEAEARQMERSARAFDLVTDVRGVPDLGDWAKNCGQKAAFIRDRMQDYPGHPIVWLDADARVRQAPELLHELAFDAGRRPDFAAHWLHGHELLSGTTFWGNTPGARRLAEAWAEQQMRTPSVWDQKVLQRVVESPAFDELRIHRLPASYTAIFDHPMCAEAEQVIRHEQASRRLK